MENCILRLSKKYNVKIAVWYQVRDRVYRIRIQKENKVIDRMLTEKMVFDTDPNILEWILEKMIEDFEKGDLNVGTGT